MKKRSKFSLVFPTPVGVFPIALSETCSFSGLPHARGGVSYLRLEQAHTTMSSPRPWGCFHITIFSEPLQNVFPTPVGVFLFMRRTKEDF